MVIGNSKFSFFVQLN